MSQSTRKQIERVFVAAAAILAASSGTAMAQERLPVRGGNALNDDRAGATFLKSGAMIFIAFDRNLDLEVTDEEIEEGARLAFVHADEDENGVLTPIEQRNWAARLSNENDVIANPRLFPTSTPNQVSEDEFVQGMLMLAERFRNEEDRLFVRDLSFSPDGPRTDETTDGIERLQRPRIAEHSGLEN